MPTFVFTLHPLNTCCPEVVSNDRNCVKLSTRRAGTRIRLFLAQKPISRKSSFYVALPVGFPWPLADGMGGRELETGSKQNVNSAEPRGGQSGARRSIWPPPACLCASRADLCKQEDCFFLPEAAGNAEVGKHRTERPKEKQIRHLHGACANLWDGPRSN